MNVCLFELKAQGKSAALWVASLVGGLLAFLLEIYPLFEENTQDILRMLSGFPPQFTAAFGMDVFSCSRSEGSMAFLLAISALSAQSWQRQWHCPLFPGRNEPNVRIFC